MAVEVILKRGRERSLFYKHPWVFSGAIEKVFSRENGEILEVKDADGKFLCKGYYNGNSNIAVRVLTWKKEEIDLAWMVGRVKRAGELRKELAGRADVNAYRAIFSEGDGLPGLVVDKFNEILVVQISTMGMEKLRSMIVEALVEVFQPMAIYERSDLSVRKLEGLTDQPMGVLYQKDEGDLPKNVEILEYGLKYLVDFSEGQKTGFFLDQRENRRTIREKISELKAVGSKLRVLNLFCYSGGFSCAALAGGADEVISVDVSEQAIKLCEKNVALNFPKLGDQDHQAVGDDVFEYLEDAEANGEKFDLIIVDPPAFIKSQKNLENGLKAYARLNEQALRVLKPGGILVSSSCSAYLKNEDFRKTLFQSALRNKFDLVVIEQKVQPIDHPVSLYFPEGEYLKFLMAKVR
jgi:23S rRNA (cytosine1962-C5)-methyltransferase